MDEILTRWAADLAKYQREFQKSAKQVASWDMLLVKNTEKISKLYAKAFQAERDAGEVEKQISAVEAEQDELEAWLGRYEGEVEDMVRKSGVSGDGGLGGIDQEREKVYRVAERVTERLEGLNRDLGDVIDEVNGVSAVVGKSSGPDDQVSLPIYNAMLLELTPHSYQISSAYSIRICSNYKILMPVLANYKRRSILRSESVLV
jgi:nuclear pore complex protein Nup62